MKEKNNFIKGISVVVPTYNRPDYLRRLLNSINKQSLQVNEVIIVNDHSFNAEEYEIVIDEFSTDLNIIYIYLSENMGAPVCRNIGIERCKYEYIALTDDDDEWLPKKIELQYKKIVVDNCGLVYTHGVAVDESGDKVYSFAGQGRGNDIKSLLKSDFIPSSSVMVRKTAITQAGLFDKKFPSCQDWDMWIRIIARGYLYDVVEEELLVYHKHNGPTIGNNPKADLGYKLFYRKHMRKYFRCFLFSKDFIILLKAIKKVLL